MDLKIYKLRADLDEESWGLRSSAQLYRPVEVREISGLDSVQLFVATSSDQPPKWQEVLLTIADRDPLIVGLRNQTTGAILCIRYRQQRFLVVFGTGWQAVDVNSIVASFGLKVVANAIDEDSLKGAKTQGLLRAGRNQKVSIPGGRIHELGIEVNEDMVRQLEGRPPRDFANDASGGDMLRLNLPDFSLLDLPYKLDEIIHLAEATEYKDKFSFLDYFVRVPRSDKRLNAELFSRLTEIALEQPERIAYANPEIDADFSPDCYRLRHGKRTEDIDELNSRVICEIARDWNVTDPLRRIRVEPMHVDSSDPFPGHELGRYAAANLEVDSGRYSICAGIWYLVDSDHLRGIQTRIDRIPEIDPLSVNLLDWDSRYGTEEQYNAEMAKASGMAILDRRLFTAGKRNNKLEICDLLTVDKKLICVKKAESSSTLSHLFAQGHVSASMLADDVAAYRDSVMKHLTRMDGGADFGDVADWTVVFAIATRSVARLSQSLFFFSKVNLDRTFPAIRRQGLKVELARIPLTKPQVPRRRKPKKSASGGI